MKQTKEVDFLMDDLIEIDGTFYVGQDSYDGVWHIYEDLLKKAIKMNDKLTELGIDVDAMLIEDKK